MVSIVVAVIVAAVVTSSFGVGAEVGGFDFLLKEPEIEKEEREERDVSEGEARLGVETAEGPASSEVGESIDDKPDNLLLTPLLDLLSSVLCAPRRGLCTALGIALPFRLWL